MAKPKKERNMSALDYLYKKLSWVGNKIEISSGGRVSKRNLLIYICVSIFVVSVYFGKVIGGFTFVLVLITLWNAKITQGLLKQSRETFEQSRIAFLVDITDRTVEYVEKLPKNHTIAEETSYVLSKAEAFKTISEEMSIEFLKAMIGYGIGKNEIIEKELKKLEQGKTLADLL